MAASGNSFEWDDAKSQDCFIKRGFNFAYAAKLWDQPVMEREDSRLDYGEIRIQAMGVIEGRHFGCLPGVGRIGT